MHFEDSGHSIAYIGEGPLAVPSADVALGRWSGVSRSPLVEAARVAPRFWYLNFAQSVPSPSTLAAHSHAEVLFCLSL